MKKIGWSITNNGKIDDDFKEYDNKTYDCLADDAWAVTKLPQTK